MRVDSKTATPKAKFPITKDNYKQHRLSDFVESVVYDIDRVLREGIKMNMNAFVNMGVSGRAPLEKCTVCLGTMALLGFEPIIDKKALRKINSLPICNVEFDIPNLFDRLRLGDYQAFKSLAKNIFDNNAKWTRALDRQLEPFVDHFDSYTFSGGVLAASDIRELKEYIRGVARILRQHGL